MSELDPAEIEMLRRMRCQEIVGELDRLYWLYEQQMLGIGDVEERIEDLEQELYNLLEWGTELAFGEGAEHGGGAGG